jgi:CheY-like chemotaxis protein
MILVTDDEESVCRLVQIMLTRCGHTVATAPDGKMAGEMYRKALKAGEPFNAVIMDLTIPGGLGGKEAIRDLLATDPGVRAIVSSGYTGDPVMANFEDFGFKGIAAKPYTQKELRDVVTRVLA